jgi:hypothetical protein
MAPKNKFVKYYKKYFKKDLSNRFIFVLYNEIFFPKILSIKSKK